MNNRFLHLACAVDLSYNEEGKAEFHRLGKSLLKKIAKLIGLAPGTYDVRSNMGGIAVSGEVTLHGETIYIQFSQSALGPNHGFMWRSCKGRKDYTGGQNRWMKWEKLLDLEAACEEFKQVALAPAVV